MLINIIFFKFDVFLVSISTRWVDYPLVVFIVTNTLISLRALSISKVFYAGTFIEEGEVVKTFLTLIAAEVRKPVVFELTSFKTCLLMRMNLYINPLLLETFHVSFWTWDARVFPNVLRLLDVFKLGSKFEILVQFLLIFQLFILFMNLS